MGLREKVALATVAVIASRILCSSCMPRLNYSVTNSPGSLKTINKDYSTREMQINKRFKKNTLDTVGAVNESKKLRFPEVEYPSSSQVWDYYRFQNEYKNDLKSKVNHNTAADTSLTRNFEHAAKHKRRYDMISNTLANPVTADKDLEYDPAPQPYCFRKSSYFPEVDYPLSARDMWIPKYWNRHLGTERDKNDVFEQISPNHDNNLRNCIIKTANANNEIPIKSMKYNKSSKHQSESEHVKLLKNITTNVNSHTTQTIIVDNCESVDIPEDLSTPAEPVPGVSTQSELNAQDLTLSTYNDTPSVLTATETSCLTTEILPVTMPMTISTKGCIVNNDLFAAPRGTTVPMTFNGVWENNTLVTIPDFINVDTDDVTTVLPLEYLTPSLPSLNKSADEYIMSQTENAAATSQASAPKSPLSSSISPNPSLKPITSDKECDKVSDIEIPNVESTPSVITNATYKSPSDDILLICTDNPKASSVVFLDDLDEHWVFSPNDSIITWESFPEYADDWIIVVDTENNMENEEANKNTESVINSKTDSIPGNEQSCLDSLASELMSPSSKFPLLPEKQLIVNDIDNTKNTDGVDVKHSVLNFSTQENIFDASQISPPVVNETDNIMKSIEESVPVSQYYEDKCAPCTDSPDDSWAVCPEYANGSWPTNGSDPYVT